MVFLQPLKNVVMANSERNKSEKGYARLKAMQHIAMGIVYLVFAGVMFYLKKFGALDLSAGVAYALGGILVLYGIFRLWRGFAEMKMIRNSEQN